MKTAYVVLKTCHFDELWTEVFVFSNGDYAVNFIHNDYKKEIDAEEGYEFYITIEGDYKAVLGYSETTWIVWEYSEVAVDEFIN